VPAWPAGKLIMLSCRAGPAAPPRTGPGGRRSPCRAARAYL